MDPGEGAAFVACCKAASDISAPFHPALHLVRTAAADSIESSLGSISTLSRILRQTMKFIETNPIGQP